MQAPQNKSFTTLRRPNFPDAIAKPNFDPHTTLCCFQCEIYGHSTKQCIYDPFCSLCFMHHVRGTQQKCFKTKWDRLSPSALKRFKLIPNQQSSKQFYHSPQGYNKSNYYSPSVRPNQFIPRHHSKSFPNRQHVNHVQEYSHEEELTQFQQQDDHTDLSDFPHFSNELQEYSQESSPSI